MFCSYFVVLYTFFGTNLLTRYHSSSSLFSVVLYFRKVIHEIFSELDETKSEVNILPKQRQSPEGGLRGATSLPDHPMTRPRPGPRLGGSGPSRSPTDLNPPPIYSRSRENPEYQSLRPQKVPSPPPSSRQVSGVRSSCFGTRPGWGLTPGAISIVSTASPSTP